LSIRIEHDLDELEKLFDLLFTITDEAVIQFTPTSLIAINMDPSRVSAYRLEAPREFFYSYTVEKEVFGYFIDRRKVKGIIRALRATGAVKASITSRNNSLLLDETEIGKLEPEKTEFDVPKFKIDLPNRVSFDGRSLKRFLASARKAHADNIGLAWLLREREFKAVAFDEEVWLPLKEFFSVEIVQDSGAGYKISLVERFLPPSIFLRKGWPPVHVLGARGFMTPIALSFVFAGLVTFEGYVAPNYDAYVTFMTRLGLLKELTKEEVLKIVNRHWAAKQLAIEKWEIERELQREGVQIEKLDELLRQLVKEEKLIVREKGWKRFYSPSGKPPKLKPLTEDIVLQTLGEFQETVKSEVGFSELEGLLAREYVTDPLHEILLSLKEKGLVEVKPWPVGRPGGYAVDMRGYWGIRVTKPEKVVEEAERAETKAKEVRPQLKTGNIVKVSGQPGLWEVISVDGLLHLEQVGQVPRPTYIDAPPHTIEVIDRLDAEEVLRAIKEVNGISYEIPVLIAVVVDTEKWVWAEKDFKKFIVENNRIPNILSVEPIPPPKIPAGYAKVRFLRDMVRFIGIDKRMYGPFKAHDETIIPTQHADIFEKHHYVEVVARASPGESAQASSQSQSSSHTDNEKQPITMEYSLLEYGATI
jgi:hypothetical protein